MSRPTELANDTILEIHPPLEVPQESPRVGINDPGFKKLTTAEKLNDSNYRQLVYQTHPDEATCACEPLHERLEEHSPDNFLVCRSGCNNVCCWRMRQSVVAPHRGDNANKDDECTYCVGNRRDVSEEGIRKPAVHNGDYCCGNGRLRGGGEGGKARSANGPPYGKASGRLLGRLEDARDCRNSCADGRRLAGGAAFEYAERLPLYRNAQASKAAYCNEEFQYRRYPGGKNSEEHAQRTNHDRSNLYRSALIGSSNEPIAAACVCPGRELAGAIGKREAKELGKKRLPVIESLVKAFQETQDFVDSLGKVPGLAGLGLMDPAESPYFGRIRTKESELEGAGASKSLAPTTLPNPQCTGPCNAEAIRSMNDGSSGSPMMASPPRGLPGRGGVVREAVPSMPEPGLTFPAAKLRRRDDKDKEADPGDVPALVTEPSPCGEPRCAAKRRKTTRGSTSEDPIVAEADQTAGEKKSVTLAKSGDRKMSKSRRGVRTSPKTHAGRKSSNMPMAHGGDKNGRRRSSGKSARRISFVYSAGDTYNGEAYSHKNCVDERHRVPGNMGWLWNLNETVGRLKPRPGWRPGAIGRHLREVLREARTKFSHKSRSKSSRSSTSRSRSPPRGKRSKALGDQRSVKKKLARQKRDDKEDIEPPPTLHIRRKDGTYYVTMYPIKQDTMDVPKLEEPMKPLQFKIAKNRDDASVATSSTASDMEIEFSPPAAVNRYRKKPNVVHVDTQVRQQEINDAFKIDGGVRARNKKKSKKAKR